MLHVDTGHNFPEVLEYRDRAVARANVRLLVASVQEAIDAGSRARAARRHAQPPADRDPPRRHQREQVRRRVRRRASRRGEGSGEGAGVLAARRLRPVGPATAAPRAVDLWNGRHRAGEHVRVFPLSNWTELDVWQYLAGRTSSSRRSTSRTRAGCSSATACGCPIPRHADPRRRGRRGAIVRYRTVGDMTCTGAVEAPRDRRRDHRGGRRDPVTERGATRADDRACRSRDGGPESARATSVDLLRLATAGSVDDGKTRSSAACCYDTKSVLRATSSLPSRPRPSRVAARSVDLALLTDGLAPSASRASRSTSPTATSPPRGASSSSPTPRARAVHPQHGHGRVDRRPGRPARRRPSSASPTRPADTPPCPHSSGRHLVLAVNKMDLVDFDREVFDTVAKDFAATPRRWA